MSVAAGLLGFQLAAELFRKERIMNEEQDASELECPCCRRKLYYSRFNEVLPNKIGHLFVVFSCRNGECLLSREGWRLMLPRPNPAKPQEMIP